MKHVLTMRIIHGNRVRAAWIRNLLGRKISRNLGPRPLFWSTGRGLLKLGFLGSTLVGTRKLAASFEIGSLALRGGY